MTIFVVMNTTVNRIVFIVLLLSFSLNLTRVKGFSWFGLTDDSIQEVNQLAENESDDELTLEGIYDFEVFFEEKVNHTFLISSKFNSEYLLGYSEPHPENLFSPPEMIG